QQGSVRLDISRTDEDIELMGGRVVVDPGGPRVAEEVEAGIYLLRFDQAAVGEDTDVIVVEIVDAATGPVVEDVELHGHARGDSQVAEAASTSPQGVDAGAAILNHERQPVRPADASCVVEQELELTLEGRVRVNLRRQEGTASLAERSWRQAQSRT